MKGCKYGYTGANLKKPAAMRPVVSHGHGGLTDGLPGPGKIWKYPLVLPAGGAAERRRWGDCAHLYNGKVCCLLLVQADYIRPRIAQAVMATGQVY